MLSRLLVSIAVSIGLLGVLIHFTLASAEPALWSSLVNALLSFPAVYLLLYFCASLVRTYLQSLRYRALLRASEKEVPTLFHVFLVTLSRNMFVDMLPARLGELSYIAMLNKGCRVSGESCVSSLAIAFVFDLIALGVLLAVLLIVQAVGGDLQGWMVGVVLVLGLLIVFLLVLLYPAVSLTNRLVGKIGWMQRGLLGKGADLLGRIERALDQSRNAGITGRVLVLSVGVRAAKYFGLYWLFVGVAIQFPEIKTSLALVLPALVSAEAGASLPVPAFMGFGTYEAGGTLALTVLGASAATSLMVMLAMHVLSQIIDYLLGGIGLVLFIMRTGGGVLERSTFQRISWKTWAFSVGLLTLSALFVVYELRAVKKRGSLAPPGHGEPVASVSSTSSEYPKKLDGFLVWSSNRSGNHDIWLRSFPDGKSRRVTTHPHTEYYPRISPDGTKIVFARSHQPWVSQRNVYAWDVILLDLKSGKERLLAKHGNVPTWSSDGKKVNFQRNGNQVVQLNLKTNEETILYQSGVSVQVPPKTELQTPHMGSKGQMAVTFRNTMRATAVVAPGGKVNKIGKGCQLSWAPGDRFLFKIDDGKKLGNAVHKVNPKTLESEVWFDAPLPYSHEYFPVVANTSDVLVYGASAEGHEHDTADYEIFLWVIGTPAAHTVRITYHTGNDCWPDIYLRRPL